jgi:hypothetical protein
LEENTIEPVLEEETVEPVLEEESADWVMEEEKTVDPLPLFHEEETFMYAFQDPTTGKIYDCPDETTEKSVASLRWKLKAVRKAINGFAPTFDVDASFPLGNISQGTGLHSITANDWKGFVKTLNAGMLKYAPKSSLDKHRYNHDLEYEVSDEITRWITMWRSDGKMNLKKKIALCSFIKFQNSLDSETARTYKVVKGDYYLALLDERKAVETDIPYGWGNARFCCCKRLSKSALSPTYCKSGGYEFGLWPDHRLCCKFKYGPTKNKCSTNSWSWSKFTEMKPDNFCYAGPPFRGKAGIESYGRRRYGI